MPTTTTQTTDTGTTTHVEPDPIAALIAAHAPTHAAELLRPLPTMSEAAEADWGRRVRQARHNVEGTPRGLIPVSGIRCGEYL